jgi:tripartite-type tricarboxylate transporter receptor subunit TctC
MKRLIIAAGALALLGGSATAIAQSYPAKPIRFIIPFPPGGPTDLMGRVAAERLSRAWNVQVVPDNRAGAGGNIGMELCGKSPPDGYTICIMTVAQSISPAIYRKLGYDLNRDFIPVTLMASLPSLLTVHPALPAKNVKELIAIARSKPGELTYASTGNGTSPHMLMEMFKSMAGINVLHVPYKGQAPAVVDQISGQIQLAFNTAVTVLPHVQGGKLRAIAISTKERFPSLASIPSVDESGLRGFDGSSWNGIVMPAGTSPDIINKIYQELSMLLRAPETREKFLAQGALVSGMPPPEFAAFLKQEVAKWLKVAKQARVVVD